MAGCMLLVSDISGAGVLVCWCVDAGVLVAASVFTCHHMCQWFGSQGNSWCACMRVLAQLRKQLCGAGLQACKKLCGLSH